MNEIGGKPNNNKNNNNKITELDITNLDEVQGKDEHSKRTVYRRYSECGAEFLTQKFAKGVMSKNESDIIIR